MGYFDYCCLIKGEDCELKKSQGQDCSCGDVYLVDIGLTKKLKAIYTGYGYAEIKGEEIFDLGFEEELGLDTSVKSSFLSCQVCAKNITDEVSTLEEFFKEIDEDPEITINKKIVFKEKELNDLVLCRNKINKKIRIIRKEIEKLKIN
jgi:hypothetical protein